MEIQDFALHIFKADSIELACGTQELHGFVSAQANSVRHFHERTIVNSYALTVNATNSNAKLFQFSNSLFGVALDIKGNYRVVKIHVGEGALNVLCGSTSVLQRLPKFRHVYDCLSYVAIDSLKYSIELLKGKSDTQVTGLSTAQAIQHLLIRFDELILRFGKLFVLLLILDQSFVIFRLVRDYALETFSVFCFGLRSVKESFVQTLLACSKLLQLGNITSHRAVHLIVAAINFTARALLSLELLEFKVLFDLQLPLELCILSFQYRKSVLLRRS